MNARASADGGKRFDVFVQSGLGGCHHGEAEWGEHEQQNTQCLGFFRMDDEEEDSKKPQESCDCCHLADGG